MKIREMKNLPVKKVITIDDLKEKFAPMYKPIGTMSKPEGAFLTPAQMAIHY